MTYIDEEEKARDEKMAKRRITSTKQELMEQLAEELSIHDGEPHPDTAEEFLQQLANFILNRDQQRLINTIKDPKFVAKAVEGSMEKRSAKLYPPLHREELKEQALSIFAYVYASRDDLPFENLYKDVDKLLALFDSQREADQLKAVPDLAWCLGKLRGLGHPNEAMEKRWNLEQLEQRKKEEL
jgi:hypothetical protein